MTTSSFTFTADRDGAHVHVTVRCGVEGQRALCGNLTMRPEEWELLRAVLAPGSAADRVVFGGGDAGVEAAVRSLIAAHRSLQTDSAYTQLSISSARPEVIDYAFAHADPVMAKYDGRSGKGGNLYATVDGITVYVDGIPRTRFAPGEPEPLPSCFKCKSTAAPNACPCRTPAPVEEVGGCACGAKFTSVAAAADHMCTLYDDARIPF